MLTKLAYGAPALATTSLTFLVREKEEKEEIDGGLPFFQYNPPPNPFL